MPQSSSFQYVLQYFYPTYQAEKYRQFGFSFKLLNHIHWFQFSDDIAVITGQESENQHLLSHKISPIFAETLHQQ
jgi:hypothetical protein